MSLSRRQTRRIIERRIIERRIMKYYQRLEQNADQREAEAAAQANMTVEEYRNAQMASAKMRLMIYRPPDDNEEYKL